MNITEADVGRKVKLNNGAVRTIRRVDPSWVGLDVTEDPWVYGFNRRTLDWYGGAQDGYPGRKPRIVAWAEPAPEDSATSTQPEAPSGPSTSGDPATGPRKFDRAEGKAPVTMIPSAAVLAEAKVLEYGAKKYGRDNWRAAPGFEWTRLADAALRHILAWNNGETNDPETGLNHLAHARCSLGFLLHYADVGLGTDDRVQVTDD